MPGLFGLMARAPDAGLRRRFEDGLRRMQRGGPLRVESVTDAADRWAFGRAHLGALQPAPQGPVDGDLVVWLHGDLTNAEDLRRREGVDSGAATRELVGRLYRRRGVAFASALEGAFAAAVFDQTADRLVLAADGIGSYPLYWRSDAREFALSSDLTALIGATDPKPPLDPRAVADYLTLGFVAGDRTLAAGISLLGPGQTLVVERASGDVRVTSTSALPDLFGAVPTTRAEYLDAVVEAFSGAVQRSLAGGHAFALSLSGGLDSRALLAAMDGAAEGLTTYTLGVSGCADEVIAERLAGLARTRHRFFELSDQYLRDFLPNMATMVSLTDGLYLSHGFTEVLALQFIARLDSAVLLRGHGGELAKGGLAWPFHTDPEVYRLGSLSQLADYLASRVNYLTPHVPLGELLDPSVAQQAGPGGRESLREILSGLPLTPPQACGYLYLREHHRRYTVPSLELFRTRMDVRLPFVDAGFLRVLLAAPPEWREGTEVHRAIITRGHAALARVRNSNTGAPADAGPLAERLLEKVNALLRRANVRGYRHYHNFDGWMRRMLLESVERELLASSARVSAWVRPDVMRRLVAETRAGSANHAYLLQGLLILELWQRENGVAAGGS